MTPPIELGCLCWRDHAPGVWRVLAIEERAYARGDYLPIGKALGDPAPAHVVLERVLDHDYHPPKAAGRGHAPRRAGAPITSLSRITKADLDALVRRIGDLASSLPT